MSRLGVSQMSVLKVGEDVKVFKSNCQGAKDYINRKGKLTDIKINKNQVVHVVTFPDKQFWFYTRDELRRA